MNIRFIFDLDKNPMDRELIKARNYALTVHIEGLLEIYFGERLFFLEIEVCLLEFGIVLTKWLRKTQGGVCEDMDYWTIDYDEDAIIQFLYQGDGDWKVYSIWQEFDSDTYYQTDLLIGVLKQFLFDLNAALSETYGIKMDEFIDR